MTPAQAAPRKLSEELGPEVSSLRHPDVHAQDLAPAVVVHADRDDHRHRDDAAVLADLQIRGVDPDVGPLTFKRTVEKGLDASVDLFTEPADLGLGNAAPAHNLDQIVHRARGDALDVGLLDHRRQRLLRKPPRLQEAWEVAALAQPGDAQLDGAGAGLPVPVTVAVALHQPLGALLAVRRAGQPAHLQLHQPLGGEADHLTQEIGVRRLLQQRAQVHALVGHVWTTPAGQEAIGLAGGSVWSGHVFGL